MGKQQIIKKNLGFTLAEVLVTLIVIGVVASLTIPALMQNIQDAQYHTALKETFSIINQATQRLFVDNGGTLEGVFSNHNDMRDKYIQYMSYSKTCPFGESFGNCWPLTFKGLDGSTPLVDTWVDASGVVLNNGSLLLFYLNGSDCNSQFVTTSIYRCGPVMVDVNGFKGPNVIGRDIYGFHIKKDRIQPWGEQGDSWGCTGSGEGCTAQFLHQ